MNKRTQLEISNSITGAKQDNPKNRSNQISLKNIKNHSISVGLEDIDNAIFYYFENIIKPIVYQNGETIKVPIIYGNPERWKSMQKDGGYRDKSGALLLPVIAITRTSLTKDRTVTNKLDANRPNLYTTLSKNYNQKNSYSNFNILNNRKPVEQFNITVVPSYVTIEYECLIQTYYFDQLNKLIEAIEYASDSYWGNPEEFKFRSFIDNFKTTTEISTEKERFAKGSFTIRLRGYIVPDVLQKDIQSIKIINSKSKITINTEIVSNLTNI